MLIRPRLVSATAAALMLMTSALPAQALPWSHNAISIRNDSGGYAISYALKMMKLRESGTPVRFVGRCASACTLYLALPSEQTCVSSGATFRFHAPYGAHRSANALMARYMLKTYPDWVRSWIGENGGLSSRTIVMDYGYASQFMPICDAESLPRYAEATTGRSDSSGLKASTERVSYGRVGREPAETRPVPATAAWSQPQQPRPRPSPVVWTTHAAVEAPPFVLPGSDFTYCPAAPGRSFQGVAGESGALGCVDFGLTCPERLESCGRLWPPYIGALSRSRLLDPPVAAISPGSEQAWAEAAVVGGLTMSR